MSPGVTAGQVRESAARACAQELSALQADALDDIFRIPSR
jgi:hypothetical protein